MPRDLDHLNVAVVQLQCTLNKLSETLLMKQPDIDVNPQVHRWVQKCEMVVLLVFQLEGVWI